MPSRRHIPNPSLCFRSLFFLYDRVHNFKNLTIYGDTRVSHVDPQRVTLDLVESQTNFTSLVSLV